MGPHWVLGAVAVGVLGVASGALLLVGAAALNELLAPERGPVRIACFVGSTLLCSAALFIWGKRPWRFGVELFDWLREPPPGTAIVNCYVHIEDRERAAEVLLREGFAYVAEAPDDRPPRSLKLEHPVIALRAWDVQSGGSEGSTRAYHALKDAGIRVLSLVGAAIHTG